jgi:hypothetical protein
MNIVSKAQYAGRVAAVPPTAWRKSSRSYSDGCLEVAAAGDAVALRDSTNPHTATLVMNRTEWTAFLAGAKGGDFDDLLA